MTDYIKVRMSSPVVKVNAQAYADSYGIDLKDVRQDVKDTFATRIQEILDELGVGAI